MSAHPRTDALVAELDASPETMMAFVVRRLLVHAQTLERELQQAQPEPGLAEKIVAWEIWQPLGGKTVTYNEAEAMVCQARADLVVTPLTAKALAARSRP